MRLSLLIAEYADQKRSTADQTHADGIVSVFFKQYYRKQIKYLHDLEFQDKLIKYRIKETWTIFASLAINREKRTHRHNDTLEGK